ncbi:MAG: hypothetical protein P4L22_00665 [Candidatus Babeliales bacterium]|nr:hypothetical protein [Candidatus Babeliales bacterium]
MTYNRIFLVIALLSLANIYSSEPAKQQKPTVIIFNGASCAGKTTITDILKTVTPNFTQKWIFLAQDSEELECYPTIDSDILNNYDHRAILGKILDINRKSNTRDFCICCDLVLHLNEEIDEFLKILRENGLNPNIILIDCPRNIIEGRALSRSTGRQSSEGAAATANKALEDWDELHEKEETSLNTPSSISDRKFSIPEAYSEIDPELISINSGSKLVKPKYKEYKLVIDTSSEKTQESIRRILYS